MKAITAVVFLIFLSVAVTAVTASWFNYWEEHDAWEATFDDIVTLNYNLTDGLDVFDTLNITGGQAFLDELSPTIVLNATTTDNFGPARLTIPNGVEDGDFLLLFINSDESSSGTPSLTDPNCNAGSILFNQTNYDTNDAADGDRDQSWACQIFADGTEDGFQWGWDHDQSGHLTALAFYAIRNHGMADISDISLQGTVSNNGIDSDSTNLNPPGPADEFLWISYSAVIETNDLATGTFGFTSYPTNYNLGQINAQRDSGTSPFERHVGIALSARLLTADSENPDAYDWFCTVSCDHDSEEGWNAYTIAIPAGFETSGALRFTIPANTHVQDITIEFDDTTTDASGNNLRNRLLNSVPSTIYTGPIIDTETSPVTHANINVTNAAFLQVGFTGDSGSGPFLNNSTVVYAIIVGPEPLWDSTPLSSWIGVFVTMIILYIVYASFRAQWRGQKGMVMKFPEFNFKKQFGRLIQRKRRKR